VESPPSLPKIAAFEFKDRPNPYPFPSVDPYLLDTANADSSSAAASPVVVQITENNRQFNSVMFPAVPRPVALDVRRDASGGIPSILYPFTHIMNGLVGYRRLVPSKEYLRQHSARSAAEGISIQTALYLIAFDGVCDLEKQPKDHPGDRLLDMCLFQCAILYFVRMGRVLQVDEAEARRVYGEREWRQKTTAPGLLFCYGHVHDIPSVSDSHPQPRMGPQPADGKNGYDYTAEHWIRYAQSVIDGCTLDTAATGGKIPRMSTFTSQLTFGLLCSLRHRFPRIIPPPEDLWRAISRKWGATALHKSCDLWLQRYMMMFNGLNPALFADGTPEKPTYRDWAMQPGVSLALVGAWRATWMGTNISQEVTKVAGHNVLPKKRVRDTDGKVLSSAAATRKFAAAPGKRTDAQIAAESQRTDKHLPMFYSHAFGAELIGWWTTNHLATQKSVPQDVYRTTKEVPLDVLYTDILRVFAPKTAVDKKRRRKQQKAESRKTKRLKAELLTGTAVVASPVKMKLTEDNERGSDNGDDDEEEGSDGNDSEYGGDSSDADSETDDKSKDHKTTETATVISSGKRRKFDDQSTTWLLGAWMDHIAYLLMFHTVKFAKRQFEDGIATPQQCMRKRDRSAASRQTVNPSNQARTRMKEETDKSPFLRARLVSLLYEYGHQNHTALRTPMASEHLIYCYRIRPRGDWSRPEKNLQVVYDNPPDVDWNYTPRGLEPFSESSSSSMTGTVSHLPWTFLYFYHATGGDLQAAHERAFQIWKQRNPLERSTRALYTVTFDLVFHETRRNFVSGRSTELPPEFNAELQEFIRAVFRRPPQSLIKVDRLERLRVLSSVHLEFKEAFERDFLARVKSLSNQMGQSKPTVEELEAVREATIVQDWACTIVKFRALNQLPSLGTSSAAATAAPSASAAATVKSTTS
jgi:hypothetical protein